MVTLRGHGRRHRDGLLLRDRRRRRAVRGDGRSRCSRASSTGQEIVAPAALWRRIAGSLNRLGRGVGYNAICAIDIAAWDLHARAPRRAARRRARRRAARHAGLHLGRVRRLHLARGGGGASAQAALARGIRGVKIRVAGVHADLARMGAVRDVLPDGHPSDGRRQRALRPAARALARRRLRRARHAVAGGAAAVLRLRGLRAARAQLAGRHRDRRASAGLRRVPPAARGAVARGGAARPGDDGRHHRDACASAPSPRRAGVVVAPHFNPALFIHVAAAAPAMKWLEDFPVLEPLFANPPEWDKNGDMAMPTGPGHGIAFHEPTRGRSIWYATSDAPDRFPLRQRAAPARCASRSRRRARGSPIAQLAARVDALAAGLQAIDAAPQSRVGICAHNTLDHLLALLATMAAGKIWVPLNPREVKAELDAKIAVTRPSIVIADEDCLDKFTRPNDATLVVGTGGAGARRQAAGAAEPAARRDPGDQVHRRHDGPAQGRHAALPRLDHRRGVHDPRLRLHADDRVLLAAPLDPRHLVLRDADAGARRHAGAGRAARAAVGRARRLRRARTSPRPSCRRP